jgi:hypothetical protein
MDKTNWHTERQQKTDLVPPPSLNLLEFATQTSHHQHGTLKTDTNAEVVNMINGFTLTDLQDAKVKEACIDAVPPGQYTEFRQAKNRIQVVDDVADYDKETGTHHATLKPQGYKHGWTWQNVDVFYDPDAKPPAIGVCRHFILQNSGVRVQSDTQVEIPKRFRHEFGHALDAIRGYPMQNSAVMKTANERFARNNSRAVFC